MSMVGKKFFSKKSHMCKSYGEGLIVEEYGDTIKVIFRDTDLISHIGIFTKSKHIKENEF